MNECVRIFRKKYLYRVCVRINLWPIARTMLSFQFEKLILSIYDNTCER